MIQVSFDDILIIIIIRMNNIIYIYIQKNEIFNIF
jgi:hypothetical protein